MSPHSIQKSSNLDVISPLVVDYCRWLSGHGGTPPDELMDRPLTDEQRQLLIERMADADFLYSVTAPLRKSLPETSP